MAFFDATLFTVIPRLYRALDAALDPPTGRAPGPASDTGRTGTRPPRVGAFLRLGSWIGGDRDGNPGVTAEITERTLRIQADHVLRGYEAVATRLMQTIAAAATAERVAAADRVAPGPRRRGPARDRPPAPPPLPGRAVPPALRVHRRAAAADARVPGRRGGATDRAVRRRRPTWTRSWSRSATRSSPTASAGSPGARSRNCAGSSGRSGSTSPRSRSASTPRSIAAALAAIRAGAPGDDRGRPGRHARRGPRHVPGDRRGPGTVRRPRPATATSSASPRPPSDITDVLELARHALATTDGDGEAHPPPVLDLVPLFESSEPLQEAGAILGALLDDPVVPRRPGRARRPPGGDARLLGLEQGVGVPGGRLDAPPGAVGAGRRPPGRAASS